MWLRSFTTARWLHLPKSARYGYSMYTYCVHISIEKVVLCMYSTYIHKLYYCKKKKKTSTHLHALVQELLYCRYNEKKH